MATLTNSQRLREARKKREEESKNSSSQSASGNLKNSEKLAKRSMERNIGFDTFESDLTNLGSTIQNVYGGWQDQETLANTRSSVESMMKRINDFQTYQSKYGNGNTSNLVDIANGYQTILDDWDNLSSTYGYFENAEAYNSAIKKTQFDKQFEGLTYDDVQKKLAEYDKDSDEYNYLSQYTNYTNLNDFDKAVEAIKNQTKDKKKTKGTVSDGFMNILDEDNIKSPTAANGSAIEVNAGMSPSQKEYLRALEKERNKYALDHTFDRYAHIQKAEDFAENNQYKETEYNGLWDRLANEGKDVYEYVHYVQEQKKALGEFFNPTVMAETNKSPAGFGTMPEGIENMTDEEFETFYYIVNTGGEEGYKKGLEFIKDMEVTLSKRGSEERLGNEKEWLEDGDAFTRKLKQGVMSAMGTVISPFTKLEDTVQDTADLITGNGYNPYGSNHNLTNSIENVRDTTRENIEEYTVQNGWAGTDLPIIGNAWTFGYDTASSIGESATGVGAFGKAYSVIAGIGAVSSRAKELKEQGASDGQIIVGSVASGVMEWLGEKIGIDNLFKIKNADSMKNILKGVRNQLIAEGGEEAVTEFGNIAIDLFNRGTLSDAYLKYQEYMDRGFGKEEAFDNTLKDLGTQIAASGIGGMLSGAVMGGGYSAIQYNDFSNVGKEIRSNDRVQEMMDMYDLMEMQGLTPEESQALESYARYSQEGVTADNISNAQLGNLYRTTQAEAIATRDSKKSTEAQKTDASKRLGDLAVVSTSKPISERVESFNKGENTEITSTGAKVDIEGIRIEGKDTIVVTSAGEVKSEDMTFSRNDAEIISYTEGMSKEKANLFVKQYDGKMNTSEYRNAFDLAYSIGEAQLGITYAAEKIKSLNTTQLSEIYKAGRQEKVTLRDKQIKAIQKKYTAKQFYKGTVNDSVIDYTNSGKGKINWNDLTSGQKENVEFAKALYTGLGIKLRFDTEGVEKGYDGFYDPKHNEIVMDLYAGVGKHNIKDADLAIVTKSSHELTHWMETRSPEMYAKLKDHIFETLAMKDGMSDDKRIEKEIERIAEQAILHNRKIGKITPEYAISEIVARGCEDMLSMSDIGKEAIAQLTEEEQKSFFAKVKEILKDMIDYISEILGRYKSKSKEALALQEYQDRLKEQLKLWEAGMREAIAVNQSVIESGSTLTELLGQKLENGISEDGTTIVGENALQMSEKTYSDGGREYLQNWLKKKVKDKFISKDDADDIVEQTDKIYRIMQDIKENNELPDYSKWAATDITTDENGKKISVIVKNGDYAMNLDLALVCKKRIALNAVLNALVQSNDLSMYTLTETDVAELNAIIKKHEFEIACALCFVDSKRYRVGSWANSFCEGSEDKNGKKYGFNEMVRSLVPVGSHIKIDEFNFTGRDIVNQPTENLLKDADDSELTFALLDQIMKDNPPAANGAKSAQYRYAEAIKNNKELRSILNPSEIISSIGLDAIRTTHTKLFGLINGHQGTAKPKFAHMAVAFKNDILKASSWTIEKAKMVGGVRLQSFSDFMANMVFDYVQMISELSAKQLTAHAYTKEPLFVKLFGLTGIKINMSLVPKVNLTEEQIERFRGMTDAQKETDEEYQRLMQTAGLRINENGEVEYLWEDETFPYDVAMDIMADKRYTKNCGTICVGISNAHIKKLLADERISMVIPYHKSGLNPLVAEMRNIALYKDYTNVQNTRYASGEKLDTKKHKDFNFYGDLYGTAKKPGTHDPKQTAQNYLAWCEKHNYLPKFDEFKDDANYYKLLVDFSVYDINDNMRYTEQEAVKAVYPSEEEFKDLILNGVVKNGVTYGGLKQSQTVATKLSKETKEIIDEFRKVLTDKYGEDVLGRHYADKDVSTLTNDDYSEMKKHFGTTNNFMVAGYMLQDGYMLDFSGKHWGDTTSRSRQVDHRDIQEVISDEDNGVDSMVRMISNGNIRLMPESGGINLAVAPTKNQRTVLRRYIDYMNQYQKEGLVLDIDEVGGDTIKSFTYEAGTSADRILGDIDRYFKGGYQSELMNFHIQYSDRDSDGNQLTEAQQEFFKNSKVRDNEGNLIVMYHGTDSYEEFTVFKKGKSGYLGGGIYFSSDKRYADRYAKSRGYEGRIYATYVDVKNPLIVTSANPAIEILGEKVAKRREMKNSYSTTWITNADIKKLQEKGYDGIVWKFGGSIEVSVWNANQIKLTTNTNPTEDEDIRYSDRDEDRNARYKTDNYYSKITPASRKDAEKLNMLDERNIARYRKEIDGVFDGSLPVGRDVIIGMPSEILIEHGVSNRPIHVTQNIVRKIAYPSEYKIGDDFVNTRAFPKTQGDMGGKHNLGISVVKNLPLQIAQPIAITKNNDVNKNKNSLVLWTNWISEDGKGIMLGLVIDSMGVTGLQNNVSTVFQAETGYAEQFFEKEENILYPKNKKDIDQLLSSRRYMPRAMVDDTFIKNLTQKFPNVKYADRDIDNRTLLVNALESMAQTDEERERLAEYKSNVEKINSMQFKLDAIKSQMKELIGTSEASRIKALSKEAEDLERRIVWHDKKLLKLEAAEPLQQVVARVRKMAKKKGQEYAKERLDSYKERVNKKAKVESIKRKTMVLRTWLEKNTKDKHIPQELKEPVRDFLVAIDFASRDSGIDTSSQKEALKEISKNIQEARAKVDLRANLIALQMATSTSEEMQRAGVDFTDEIEALTKSINSLGLKSDALFVLKDMSVDDLIALDKIVTTLKTVVTRANEFYTLRRKQSITASAHELFDLFNTLGDVKESDLDKFKNFFNYENTLPIHFFDRLGDVGQDLFHSFIKAQDKMAFLKRDVQKFADSTWTSKDVQNWDTDLIEFEVIDARKTTDINNPVMKKVYTTTSRLMTLYLQDKREQSKGHLYKGGGGRFTTFKHDGKTYGEDVNGVVLTPQLVKHMLSELDPKARDVADAISKFLNNECKDWGNEITLDLYGTELFVEPNYIPIEVIAESVSRKIDKAVRSITALLNKGFTKETKPNAKNQIVLDSIFDVFAKHTSEMMAYNAYAREVYDAVRLFEYKESRQTYVYDSEEGQTISDNIQTAMSGALGKGAVSYFRNFLEDINGTQQAGRGDNMLAKAFSNSKLANVAWNMNVALLQPLSLVRAMTMINPKYLSKGIFGIPSGIKKAMEHSGTALWKSYGFFDTDISKGLAEQIKNNKTLGDKFKEWSMKAPEVMDKITWGALWTACEYQVLGENESLTKGSKEFYDKVVELFEETIYRTQVMDSVLSRSQIMRSKSGVVKGLTSYMAEPLVTYNMVYSIFSQWNLYSRSGHSFNECRNKYGKKLATACGVYGLSALAEAGVRTLTTAMRNAGGDDDEKEDEKVFLQQLLENLNPLSKIPVGREISSVMQGYGVSSIPGLDTIEAFGNAYKVLTKMIVEGDEISYKKVHKILKAVSYGTGQGVSNAYRDVIAIWNSTIGQIYPSLIIDTDE